MGPKLGNRQYLKRWNTRDGRLSPLLPAATELGLKTVEFISLISSLKDERSSVFQKAIKEIVPHMYRVVIGTSTGAIVHIEGDGRRVR